MTSSCILQIFLWIAIQDQRAVVLFCDKVWDVFRWKQGIRSVFLCCCGTPPGTRTHGLLIKRSQRETIVNFQNCADLLFLSFYREFVFCICCILCTCYPLLHPLSNHSGVQKVCKNVQSRNQPLKTGIGFFCKAGKTAGFESKTAAMILPV